MRAAIVLAVIVASTTAYADDELARAHQLEAQLEYDQALAIVDGILARGGADPSRFVELQLFAGKLAAGLDRADVAQDHFARALAIRPDAALAAGTSPKLTAPFDVAKAHSVPLEVQVTVVQGLVTLTAKDSLGLVTGIAVHAVGAGGDHRDLVERTTLRLAIPAGSTAIEVAALDARGNRLWVGAPPPSVRPPPSRTVAGPVPRLQRWTTYAAVAGAAVVVGSISAWRFDSAQSDWDRLHAAGHDFTELRAIEDRGRRWGVAANISFGVAAASGITAVIFGLRHDGVAITPGPGAGVGVSGRF